VKSIAFAIENFDARGGGAESYLVDLARSFSERNWQVHVYAERWDPSIRWAVFHPIPLPRRVPGWVRILLFALRHRRHIQATRYDVIYGVGNTVVMDIYQSHGGVHWYTTMRKTYTVANPVMRLGKQLLACVGLKHHVRHWVESAAFRQPTRPVIVAISELVRRDLARWFRCDPATIHLVHNGIDPQRFDPHRLAELQPAARQRFGLDDRTVCFVFVSYELKKKGIEPLLRAVALLANRGADFRLLVVGAEPYAALRRLTARLAINDRVLFTGPVADIESVYAVADGFVLPTYYDACSLAVLEAMHCAIPVLTTETNGAAGIIEHGTSGLVASHPPHAEELCLLLERLLNAAERRRIGRAGRLRVQPYTRQANHEAIITLCEKIAAGKGRASQGNSLV